MSDPIKFTIAFQRGEEQGFTYFFRLYYAELVYYAYRIIGDKPVAEEIASDAFSKIWNWEGRSKLGHPNVIKAWLYTTVNYACIDWQRKEGRKREKEKEFKAMQEAAIDPRIQAEVLGQIHLAFTILPDQCRRVFELLYIQGKSIQEIAEELNISIYTVKNHRANGLKKLKKKLPAFLLE